MLGRRLSSWSLCALVPVVALCLPVAASAATVSLTLQPGPLAIIEAPAALTFIAGADASVTAVATVRVVDATGSKAGWRIATSLGPLIGSDSTDITDAEATITGVYVTPQTGRPPASTLVYPRALRAATETIFSAAPGSGMGKSALIVTASVADARLTPGVTYTAALVVAIISGS